jgi:hypothetical protein
MSLQNYFRTRATKYNRTCKECGKQMYNIKDNKVFCSNCNTGRKRGDNEELKNYSKMWIKVEKYPEQTLYVRNCDCCGTPYKTELSIDTTHIQRFCHPHRNEYKRNLYLKIKNG